MDDLATLLERVIEQLSYEYHDPDDAAHALETMTVKRLLEMLSYMEVTRCD